MNSRIILTALLVITLASCKSKSAFNFSEDIIKKERSLIPFIEETESKVEKFAGAEQYDSVAAAGANMEKLVQEKIDEIEKMSVPKAKEADSFKKAMLKYFKYIKSMYTTYKEWGNAGSTEERDEIAITMQKIVKDKDNIIREMQAEQRKYAKANGFRLEKE